MYSLGDEKSKAADGGRVGSRKIDPALIPAQEIPAEAIGRSLGSSTLASSTNTGHEAILPRTAQRMTMWGQVRLQTAKVVRDWKEGRVCPGGATQVVPSPTSSFSHGYCTAYSH